MTPSRRLAAPLRFPAVIVFVFVWSTMLPAGRASAMAQGGLTKSSPERREPIRLSDDPSPFVPRVKRSSVDEDRLVSESLYAEGRLLYQRGDISGALRRFQRAYRLNPQAAIILADVVSLALELDRTATGARYALLDDGRAPIDASVLRRLAMDSTEEGDVERALHLYALTIKNRADGNTEAADVLMHFEMGRLYYLTGKYEQSAESFSIVRQAMDEPGKFGLDSSLRKRILGDAAITYSVMADSFLAAGHPLAASALYEKASQGNPDDALLAFHRARVAAKQGNMDDALGKLDSYFDRKTSAAGFEPYELLEQVWKERFDGPEAESKLQERLDALHKNDPDNVALSYFIAKRMAVAGRLAQAEARYLELVQAHPTIDGYRAIIEIRHKLDNVDGFLDALSKVVSLTGNVPGLNTLVSTSYEDPAWVSRVISAAQRRLDGNRSLDGGVACAAALAATAAKRFDESEEFFRRAMDAGQPDKSEVVLTWALEMLAAEQYARSASVLQRAIRDNILPDAKAALYYYLAEALQMQDKVDEALAAAESSVRLNESNVLFQARPAWILYRAGKHREAEDRYRKLIERFDSDYQSADVREILRNARFILSNLSVMRGDLAAAEQWLEQVLDEFPEDVGAMNDLGYLWADQHMHLHLALAYTYRAVQAEPSNFAYRDSLGWTLYQLGHYALAVRHLRMATQGENPDGIVLDHLGDAYLKADDRGAALSCWQQAVESFQQKDEFHRLAATKEKLDRYGAEK